jgi:hypothetical protein
MRLQCVDAGCGRASTYPGWSKRYQREAARGGWTRGPAGVLCSDHNPAPLQGGRRWRLRLALIVAVGLVLLYVGAR